MVNNIGCKIGVYVVCCVFFGWLVDWSVVSVFERSIELDANVRKRALRKAITTTTTMKTAMSNGNSVSSTTATATTTTLKATVKTKTPREKRNEKKRKRKL